MGPDGAPRLEPARELPPESPRICGAGPCRHYHRFQIQLDAQNPMNERRPDGTVVQHGRVFHVQTHHYCYPDVGIELELGALPVLACNHWVPVRSLLRTKRGLRRQFERDLAAWLDQQAEAAPIGGDVALAEPEATIIPIKVEVHTRVGARVGGPSLTDVIGTVTIHLPVTMELHVVAEEAFTHYGLNPTDFSISDGSGLVITNTRATLEQLGLRSDEKIIVTVYATKEPA